MVFLESVGFISFPKKGWPGQAPGNFAAHICAEGLGPVINDTYLELITFSI